MATLTQSSQQWATRPADERFTSLTELAAITLAQRQRSASRCVPSTRLRAVPDLSDRTHRGLTVQGPTGNQVNLTHWSFGQLASRVGAPAGYLRTLPAPLAADALNYGLQVARNVEDIGVLLTRGVDGADPELRAVTGPNYGRVWNSDIAAALCDRFGDGLTGAFRVPGEFGKAVEVTKANTTLYAGDRDLFVFLADEDHRIEVPNRRDGKSGSLARGFFVWNSEVGSTTLGIATFLFDYVCCNRIVWGAQGYRELKVRHTVSAPEKFINEVAPALEHYAQSSTTDIVDAVVKAQKSKIDKVDEFLASRFTKGQVTAIKAAHEDDEGRPIETLWDAATGITAYARSIDWQDDRVKMEREGGKILDLAI